MAPRDIKLTGQVNSFMVVQKNRTVSESVGLLSESCFGCFVIGVGVVFLMKRKAMPKDFVAFDISHKQTGFPTFLESPIH